MVAAILLPDFLMQYVVPQRIKLSRKDSGSEGGSTTQSQHWFAIPFGTFQWHIKAFVKHLSCGPRLGHSKERWPPAGSHMSSAEQCFLADSSTLEDHCQLLKHVSIWCFLVPPTQVGTGIDRTSRFLHCLYCCYCSKSHLALASSMLGPLWKQISEFSQWINLLQIVSYEI